MAKDTQLAPTGRRSLMDAIRERDKTALRTASFEDLAGLATGDASDLGLTDADPVPMDLAQMGEGFVVVPKSHKRHLVGVPLVVVDVDVNDSRKVKGGYFTSLKVRTARPVDAIRPGCDAFIVNDGGTGIHKQMMEYRERAGGGPVDSLLPILCRHGLRVSTYEVTRDMTDEEAAELNQRAVDPVTGKRRRVPVLDPTTNEPIEGETFYLDESL